MGYLPRVRSRGLDISQDLYLRVCGPRRTGKKSTWPIWNSSSPNKLGGKEFIIWFSGNFFSRDAAGSPCATLYCILSPQLANESAGFGLSCPLAELVMKLSLIHSRFNSTPLFHRSQLFLKLRFSHSAKVWNPFSTIHVHKPKTTKRKRQMDG